MDTIKIGKNVIENLTTGMYEDSKVIYREYIQNSADQIDKAVQMGLYQDEEPYIDISIDVLNRNVQITDNANGIKKDDIAKKLGNIADSDKKKGIDKGFRGIGRLGGLAYCDTLRFITSYKGEDTKSIMTWDAKECNRLIDDYSINYSAQEILTKVITYAEEKCDSEKHFFTVELENILAENNELLEIDKISKYISSNAPVPYNNKFIYRNKIYEYLTNNNLKIDEYKIHVDDDDVLKNYSTILYESSNKNVVKQKKKYDEIYDIQFKEFRNSKDELLAWMWFGISAFDKQIPETTNEMRGIRLRKENIQIGNSYTLTKLFKEKRGNFYFIGEVNAIHRDLIPNARRDYFNKNETLNELETNLKYYFDDTLTKLYNYASNAKSACKKKFEFLAKQAEYSKKTENGFIDDKEKEKMKSLIEVAKKENEKGKNDLDKLDIKSDDNDVLKKVLDIIKKKSNSTIKNSDFTIEQKIRKSNVKKPLGEPDKKLLGEPDKKPLGQPDKKPLGQQNNKQQNKSIYLADGLNRLSGKQQKLVSKIYGIINEMLPPDLSNNLINKIQNELNKK
ncbi:ATP-binding protein [Clostridium sp. CM027]|uniref:ATP-binding protein n=1 Tax=Clostridium sp. CM027 TaxID=2849865 RepID=UPI001C6DFF44|nr:ATP-binding protein [Clostridium sp. CM027]MBW9146573.1 ATP-binding protein [Clostridium sp. CM027]UVE42258.1 ATP-binding protein [Clostridium sp. CM027]